MVDRNCLPDWALSVGLYLREPKDFRVHVAHAEYVSTCGWRNQSCVLKNSGLPARFSPMPAGVIRFFVSSCCVQAVAISGAGLELKNRTAV